MKNVNLILVRRKSLTNCTLGQLFFNNVYFCDTLEDVIRPVKIQDETAIPAGVYSVRLTFSPRFNKIMPLICDVPNFSGIRIHAGTNDKSTSGCLIVGHVQDWTVDEIINSREIFGDLFQRLNLETNEITLTILETTF